MNDEQLRLQLQAAKEFKAARIAEAETSVEKARQLLREAEERRSAWEKMIPFEVISRMTDEARRDAARAEEEMRAAQLEELHTLALRESHARQKGMLPPAAEFKGTSFGIYGATMGGLLVMYVAWFHFSVRSELALLLLPLPGAVVGLLAGFKFFDLHFVVDQSLERSPFHAFKPSIEARKSYFKRKG